MDDSNKSREPYRIWIALSASSLPVAILLFGTFSTFQGNSAEFEVGYLSLLSSYLFPGLLLVGVLMLFLLPGVLMLLLLFGVLK